MEIEIKNAARCADDHCRMIDFLPFKCAQCGLNFCKDHYWEHIETSEACKLKDNQAVVCPICKERLNPRPGENPNVTWARHEPYCRGKPKKQNVCPVPGCKEKLTITNKYQCGVCKVTFCMKHRLPEDHPCKEVRKPKSQPQPRSGGSNANRQARQQQVPPATYNTGAAQVNKDSGGLLSRLCRCGKDSKTLD